MTQAVLFVCTGNTCRSPAAAALFGARLAGRGRDMGQWWIDSAGLRAGRGVGAAAGTQAALAARGIDLSRHRAKPLEDVALAAFDVIVMMEKEQAEALRERAPALARRIWRLGDLAGRDEDVGDPYGGGQDAYAAMVAQIDALLEAGMDVLLEAAERGEGA